MTNTRIQFNVSEIEDNNNNNNNNNNNKNNVRVPVESFRPKEALQDLVYMKLQTQMMDNGWRLHQEEDDDGNINEYFIHPTYGDMKVPVYYYVCHDYHGAKSLKFPLLVREKDPKGLVCCISISGDGTRMNIIGNEWESFWKTRRGKRAAKRDRFLSKQRQRKKLHKREDVL